MVATGRDLLARTQAIPRQTAQRALAVSSLVACFVATTVVVAGAGGGPGAGEVAAARAPVAAADARLGQALRALRPGASAGAAQEAAKAAHAAGERALEVLGAATSRAERVAVTELRRHQELVDAVGSTLANPASPLRDRLRERAAGGELPVEQLLRFSRARLAD
ncbi:MAG TPA: hypothetical protein VD931_04640 [Baekduia sp.]|nr:hypothetical protein [Baekduia sp.]